jgi:hypothetical protein
MVLLAALLVTAGLGVALAIVFARVNPAKLSDYAGCRGWCEGKLAHCGGPYPTRVPEQPVNAYTNLIYAAAGVWVALSLGTAPAFVFGLALVVLCVGSALYHGLSTRWAGRFDVGSMYAVFSALAVFAIGRSFAVNPGWTAAAMLVLGAAMGLLGYLIRGWYAEGVNLKIAIFLIVPYLLAAELIVVHRATAGLHFTWGSFVLFGAAMGAWQLDRHCVFPLKSWGHGLWHLLTGLASLLLFLAVYRLTGGPA